MHQALRPATTQDILSVCAMLRPDDDKEFRLASGREPKDVLLSTPDVLAMVVPETGEVIGLCGVRPSSLIPEAGLIWMCGTVNLRHHRVAFTRFARHWVRTFKGKYSVLHNAVWSGNKMHVAWLNAIGFRFLAPHGDFIPFYMDL